MVVGLGILIVLGATNINAMWVMATVDYTPLVVVGILVTILGGVMTGARR
tara:strand:+ start:371 stop:520 length:150 start_codon:yes stop_codon:yes gene_type:complete